jgi:hypothetical protein
MPWLCKAGKLAEISVVFEVKKEVPNAATMEVLGRCFRGKYRRILVVVA